MKTKPIATCVYLYNDRHAVVMYEKRDEHVGTVQFVEIHERWTEANCNFSGRLIFDRYNMGMWKVARKAIHIRASEATFKGGSDKTRNLGIAVGSLEIWLDNEHALHWNDFRNVISNCYTHQPEMEEKFDPNLKEWSGHKVAKIVMAENKKG